MYKRVQQVTTQGVVLVEKKLSNPNTICWTPQELVAKRTVSFIAFRISWRLDVKLVFFGCHMAVCVNKRHKMQLLGVVQFKGKFCMLDALALVLPTKNWEHIKICVHLLLTIYYDFSDSNIIHPLLDLFYKASGHKSTFLASFFLRFGTFFGHIGSGGKMSIF